jgi:D-alanyl-D-alanine endopeptidase (penicillin-binding protein 7)
LYSNSLGIKTSASSVLAVDNASGAVLMEKNGGAVLPIASITKLMTAYVAAEAKPDWSSAVTIIEADKRTGDIDRIVPGEKVSLHDLFNLTLVASNNDAAMALARASAGDDFVNKMNEYARSLGMVHTVFADPTGLETTNVSSVVDLILLARAAFSVDEIRNAVLLDEYRFTPIGSKQSRIAPATDRLLNSFLNEPPYEIIGAKTGTLDEAGYCLLLQLRRDGHDITIALLGAESPEARWQEVKGLADWVFANYQWH